VAGLGDGAPWIKKSRRVTVLSVYRFPLLFRPSLLISPIPPPLHSPSP
jgi:hypothetical protein